MKKIKTMLLFLTAALTLLSCKPSTSQLEDEVINLVNEKLSSTGVKATKISLIHKGGNDYCGIITLTADGEVEEYDINVVSDGRTFQYEIPAFLAE